MYGDSYNLRNFDSIADSTVYNSSETFNQKIYQGLRISADGKKYWINVDENGNGTSSDSHDKFNESSKKLASASTRSIRGKKSKSGIIKSENIENQARVLLGSSRDGENSQKINSMTPLLNKKSDKDLQRGYVSNISDVLEDPTIFTAEEEFSISNNTPSGQYGLSEDLMKDERLYRYVHNHYIPEQEINYPVDYQYNHVEYSTRIRKLRQKIQNDNSSIETGP
ncbi:hypothetical protein PMKS-003093 [Pichia membranifaciens]|uniref:Uncharacterized protein n=1 Tax=Pichia membranifaciens TaxID=4926 RepID=A0A1Q2YJ69_9ASCO|nr:hypothetical protein PMKS-003093 [Pichia membranifaciens]